MQGYKSKKNLGSYPYFTVVVSITMALFVIGLFGLVILHASRLSDVIKGNIEIQVYLQRNISENDKININKALAKKKYVANSDGKPLITFVSKQEAADQFIAETGEQFVNFLGENPLRDAFVIKIKPDFSDAERMKIIKKDLMKMPGVFEVEYVESMVNAINNNLSKVSIVLVTFAIFLLFTVAVLINNTIKLALFSQRFLIRSMQLVGATPVFIQRPFITRAAIQGFVSGLFASLGLGAVLQYSYTHIPELELLQQPEKIIILFAILLISGSIIGLISAWLSVSRYLGMSLDELY